MTTPTFTDASGVTWTLPQLIEAALMDATQNTLEDRVTLAHEWRELCDEVLGDLEHDLRKETGVAASEQDSAEAMEGAWN